MMTDCETIREMLGDHLDGLLSDEESETVKEHLAGCEACREALREEQKLRAALKELSAEPPAELYGAVMASVRQEKNRKRRRGVLLRLLPAAAVFVLCVVAAERFVFPMLIRNGGANYNVPEGHYSDKSNASADLPSDALNMENQNEPGPAPAEIDEKSDDEALFYSFFTDDELNYGSNGSENGSNGSPAGESGGSGNGSATGTVPGGNVSSSTSDSSEATWPKDGNGIRLSMIYGYVVTTPDAFPDAVFVCEIQTQSVVMRVYSAVLAADFDSAVVLNEDGVYLAVIARNP